MKKLTLLIVSALFIQFTVSAQPCLPDGITFSTQEQIDNFQTNYPNCSEIEGDIVITGDAITNLVGLDVLTSAGGDFWIHNANNLASLTGLDNLTTIGGDFKIGNNDILTDMTGLANITSIEGVFWVVNHSVLNGFTGLQNLGSVGGDLRIEGNGDLPNMIGLENLAAIGGDLIIIYNATLTGLVGLDNIEAETITNLNIYDNPLLSYCDIENICEYLGSPNGTVYISNNASDCNNENQVLAACETDCPGDVNFNSQAHIDFFQTYYPNCSEIEGDVFIAGDDITNLVGLNVLTSIGGGNLTIGDSDNGNPNLTSLNGLEGLTYIGGNLAIVGNGALTNLTGLDNFTSIGGDLSIDGNTVLTSLSGLENLSSIGGGLRINGNNSLNTLTNLENLSGIGGNLTIANNAVLTNCEADAVCSYLPDPPGTISIYGNAEGCSSIIEVAGACGTTLPCPEEGTINLSSQFGVNYFQVVYQGCSQLECSISITGEDIVNLDSLAAITSIEGYLFIGGNSGNPNLTSLSGLEGLTSVGGFLDINGNVSLTSLTGLDNLTSIGENLSIGDSENGNPNLTSLNGLESLTFIGGNLEITDNDILTSLTGLDNLTFIGGDLGIYWNPLLSNCDAEVICTYLVDPNGTIGISNNAEGCSSMFEVAMACGTTIPCPEDGTIWLYSQFDVDHFSAVFEGCSDLACSISISGDNIVNLDSLDVITSVGGGFYVRYNDVLTSLTGLENLSSIGGELSITGNDALINLTGLDNLSSIDGNLTIGSFNPDNPNLISLTGLESLDSIGGHFYLIYNEALTTLTGLENLTSIGGDFAIYEDHGLTTLTGLENLTQIGNNLFIGNSVLQSLVGLENLETIKGSLLIGAYPDVEVDFAPNDSLTSLQGLENLNYIGNSLIIANNAKLSFCAVQPICKYLDNANGAADIHDNAPGCDSQEEVEFACPVSVDEVHLSEKLFIFPNPSSTQITIELPNAPQTNAMLSIQNMNGQKMLSSKITEQKTVVDISGLPKGLYIVKVTDDRMLMVGKMMKK